MKITALKPLALPDLVSITFARFADERGYFTETLRVADMTSIPKVPALHDKKFEQINESYSKKNVVRGLHFQWNPHMGKLVRALDGEVLDIALDIRPQSQTFGKAITHRLKFRASDDSQEWLWVPPGFAHGFVTVSTTARIEYACTGFWNPQCELGIRITDKAIDWSLSDIEEAKHIASLLKSDDAIMNEKDKQALSLEAWKGHEKVSEYLQSLP